MDCLVKLPECLLASGPHGGVVNESMGSYALPVPLLHFARIRGFLWFEVGVICSVDCLVKGLKLPLQIGFWIFRQSGTVEDVLWVPHRADLPQQGIAN